MFLIFVDDKNILLLNVLFVILGIVFHPPFDLLFFPAPLKRYTFCTQAFGCLRQWKFWMCLLNYFVFKNKTTIFFSNIKYLSLNLEQMHVYSYKINLNLVQEDNTILRDKTFDERIYTMWFLVSTRILDQKSSWLLEY